MSLMEIANNHQRNSTIEFSEGTAISRSLLSRLVDSQLINYGSQNMNYLYGAIMSRLSDALFTGTLALEGEPLVADDSALEQGRTGSRAVVVKK